MKIAVAGLGSVGLANAILLARRHDVTAIDPRAGRVAMINKGRSPVEEPECAEYLESGMLSLTATLDPVEAYRGAEVVIIATPTADADTGRFDTTGIDAVITSVRRVNPRALMVIRSTVPVGYTKALRERLNCDRILVAPDFQREGRALYDNLYPSRIVVGEVSARGNQIAELLRGAALRRKVATLLTDATEAEAIKLFTASYQALRMSFFNELDTIAMAAGLDAREVIETLSADPSVGAHDNNPSFGFGGSVPGGEARQLLETFGTAPHSMLRAIVEGNDARREAVTQAILSQRPRRVGVHRPVQATGFDDLPETALEDILGRLASSGVELVIYEPGSRADAVSGCRIETDFARFAAECDLIVANSMTPDLAGLGDKVFTRDLFGRG